MKNSERLKGDVRKLATVNRPPGWEDLTSQQYSPEGSFRVFQEELLKGGIQLTDKLKILEVGSGDGAFLALARSKGLNIVGVDVRPRANFKNFQVRARIEKLPFADETFDVIHSAWVFDPKVYEQDGIAMFNEIGRVLKKGGLYVAEEGSIDGNRTLESGLFPYNGRCYKKK